MAKLAYVGYGSEGQGTGRTNGKGYVYVVNNNVRKGDRISPVVKHYKTDTIYATTGKILGTSANTSTEKGKEMQQELGGKEATQVYTGKELGLGAQKGAGGKFTTEGGKSFSSSAGYILGEREKATRGGNVAAYQMTHGEGKISSNAAKSVETFESYSKAYLPTGKR